MVEKRTELLRAVGKAQRFDNEFSSEARLNFDVLRPFEELTIPLMFRPLDPLLGATVHVESSDDVGVMVTTRRPHHIQRFTLAHELGHVCLGHRMTFDEVVGAHLAPDRRSANPMEAAADLFASELLAPSWRIASVADRQGWAHTELQDPHVIYQLSLRLGLSFKATTWALYNCKTLSRKDATRLAKEGIPRGLKSQISAGLLENQWADSWILTEGDAGTSIEAEPDDVFALRLEELSTAGYRWQLESPANGVTRQEAFDTSVSQGVGDPTKRGLIIKVGKPTTYPLHVVQRRPWNNDVASELRLTIDARGRETEGLPRRIRETALATEVGAC